MPLDGVGGQSCVVGKSPSIALSAGVHASPSLIPASHLLFTQVGHGWMKVLQVLVGQSASVMHPWPAFEPATQAPVSHVPAVQSASEQHGVLAGAGALQRPVSLSQVPPGQDPTAVVPQPPPPVQLAPGVLPPVHRIGMRSPLRKMPELSGRFRLLTVPALQSAEPVALAVMVLTTHVLVAAPAWEAFGIGSGGPKRQPLFVHLVCAHLALVQAPELQLLPGEQSPVTVHSEAQSLSTRHAVPSFVLRPRVQWLFGGEPPVAWAGDDPARVSVVPLQLETWVNDDPWSGTLDGSGTATPAPPK